MLQNPELHYLDNAATTIVAPEVADVIDKAMREHWANPSSLYGPGARSEEALNAARAAVARTLGCKAKELYFTSCGSESNNLALLGAARTRTFGKGIVVSGFEHPSVQRPLERLAAEENVTNRLAEAFYRDHGVREIARGLDLEPTTVGHVVLRTAYCIRREIGECLLRRPRLRGELWLERGRSRYRLDFDCARCEMSLVDCTGMAEGANEREKP